MVAEEFDVDLVFQTRGVNRGEMFSDRAENRGDFAGGGSEAEVALAEAGIEFSFAQGGF